jgi:hypothetical protein
MDLAGILPDKIFPARRFFLSGFTGFAAGAGRIGEHYIGLVLIMVTDGHGQRIGSVVGGEVFFQLKDVLKHLPDPLFFRVAVAGDGLFDLFGRIFGDRDAGLYGGGDRNALRPSSFEHALYILPEEWRFDGKIHGSEAADKLMNLLVYELEAFVAALARG